jgi:hypothetical protein
MKVATICNCKNSLFVGLVIVVTYFSVLFVMPTTNAELSIINIENNSSLSDNLNKTTTTTTIVPINATLDSKIDNQTNSIQNNIPQNILDKAEVANTNSSISFDNSTTKNEEPDKSDLAKVTSNGKVTIQAEASDRPSPSVSYIENEGSPLTSKSYENKYRSSGSSEDDNNHESRDRDRNFDEDEDDNNHESRDRDRNFDEDEDKGKELLESDSDYGNFLLMMENMKQKAKLDNQKENKESEEIFKANPIQRSNQDEVRDIERNSQDEVETIEDIERNSQDEIETIEDIERNSQDEEESMKYYRIPNPNLYQPTPDPIKGSPVDNENKKLLSQFTQVNTSSIVPNLQIQSEKANATIKDNKLVANAGLDQILKDENRIVLDASPSVSSSGNITSFLWKQLGDSEEKISPSNSKIYSFPIPDELEENALEFELTVMDNKGQKASDTVKIMLADQTTEDDNDENELDNDNQEEQAQIQAISQEDTKEEEEEEEENNNDEEQAENDDNEDDDEDDDDEDDDDEDDDENE